MRPHIGCVNTPTNEVTDARAPDQKSIALCVCTPSSGKNNGMIGLRKLNEQLITSCTPTIAHIVSRHCGGSCSAAAPAAMPVVVFASFCIVPAAQDRRRGRRCKAA